MCSQPPALEDKKEEKKERVQTVELSTSAKARAKAKAKHGDDADMAPETPAVPSAAEVEEKKAAEEKEKEKGTYSAFCSVEESGAPCRNCCGGLCAQRNPNPPRSSSKTLAESRSISKFTVV